MNLTAYAVALRWADWSYEYSDDHRAYMAGLKVNRELKLLAELSDDHRKLYLFMANKRCFYA